jgi:hypothetical protein
MEPRLSLPTASTQLPMRLEPESEVVDKKAGHPVGK